MSSERRIQSSRANGAKSRGPVTVAGRHKSAYNNLRHGILSETVVLEDENSDAFDEIFAALKCEFDPQTEAQLGLVENMAASRWRLMRMWSIERQTLQSEIEKHDPATHQPAARAARAFHDLANNSRTLDVISRYETRFDRQYARSLNLLMKLTGPDCPFRKTGIHYPDLGAEGAPAPENDFCQTNLIPESDTEFDPAISPAAVPDPLSGAEGAGLAPTSPAAETIEPPREPEPSVPSSLAVADGNLAAVPSAPAEAAAIAPETHSPDPPRPESVTQHLPHILADAAETAPAEASPIPSPVQLPAFIFDAANPAVPDATVQPFIGGLAPLRPPELREKPGMAP